MRLSLRPSQRRVFRSFGIDCADKIEWKGWSPGGEYHRTLTLRNVTTKTVQFKYRLPKSKHFSMGFPELIQLRPGLSYPLRVTFRPVKVEAYADVIEFQCGGSMFDVSIAALTPTVKLELPAQLDFGYLAVSEVRTAALCQSTHHVAHRRCLRNCGTLHARTPNPVAVHWPSMPPSALRAHSLRACFVCRSRSSAST